MHPGNSDLPLSFYQSFKKHSKVDSYAELAPKRVEPRLGEIYRKFGLKLTMYRKDLKDNFNLKNIKFNPE